MDNEADPEKNGMDGMVKRLAHERRGKGGNEARSMMTDETDEWRQTTEKAIDRQTEDWRQSERTIRLSVVGRGK